MTVSNSLEAYSDCVDLFDQAMASPKGIRNGHTTLGAAQQLCTRLHYFRTLMRGHNVTTYDSIIVRRPKHEGNLWWIIIEPRAISGVVEELGAAE